MPPGTLLGDRYVIVSRAHTGGMGDVYKALDRTRKEAGDPNPWVAIKVIGAAFAGHPQAIETLQREANNCRSLTHENIVRVFDFERDGDNCFITMEWLEGESLVQLLERARQKPPNATQLRRIILGLGAALAHAHSKGITHADVKPGNVFITRNGAVKLLDFGAAHDAGGDGAKLDARTPAYSSCEVLEGETPSPSDDVFSFALLVYRLLAGQRAFGQNNALEAEASQLTPQRVANLADQAWEALAQGLAFRRADRHADVASFLEAFTAPPAATRDAATATAAINSAGTADQAAAGAGAGEPANTAALEATAELAPGPASEALPAEPAPDSAAETAIADSDLSELDDTGSGWGRPALIAASLLACAGAAWWFWSGEPEPVPVAASPRSVAPARTAPPVQGTDQLEPVAVQAERLADRFPIELTEIDMDGKFAFDGQTDSAVAESIALAATAESELADSPKPDAQLASVVAAPAVSPPARATGETAQVAAPATADAPTPRAQPKPTPKPKPKPKPAPAAKPKPVAKVAEPRQSAGQVADTGTSNKTPAAPQLAREASPQPAAGSGPGRSPTVPASTAPPVPQRASAAPDDYGPLPAPGETGPPEVAMSELDFDRFVEPRYPRSRAARKSRGWVEVEFQVNENGQTSDVKIVGSSPPEVFDEAATDAVSKWRFKPPLVDGEPVAVTSVVRLRFEPNR